MLVSTSILLFFLLLTYALFLLSTRKSEARSARLQQRVAEVLQDSWMLSADEAVQILREDSISRNKTLNRLLSSIGFIKRLDSTISQADMHITVSRLLAFCAATALLAAFAVYTVFNGIVAIVIGLIAGSLPLIYVNLKRRKRLNKFNAQLPDTLDLLSRSLSVGHAFSESLDKVASEQSEPIACEFRITFEEQKLGLSTKAALDRLAERVPIPDLRLCVTAMHIQRETGGNLAEILERVAQTIRERYKLMEDFRTMTTSARGSAWILCGLPIALIFVLTAINTDYMAVLLHDPRGHVVIVVAVVLLLTEMLLIRKILSIRDYDHRRNKAMFIMIVIFTFTSLALMVMSVYWLMSRPQSTVAARLESMDPALVLVENNPVTTMAEKVAEPLNRIVPISAVEALKLQKKMLRAGYRSPDAATAFRAIQISLLLAIPSLLMTICFMLDGSLNSFIVWSLLGAGIGFYLPRLVLGKM